MLTLLRAALAEFTPQVLSLLRCLRGNMSRDALQLALMLKDRKSFRALYLSPALEAGFIAMTLPDKPNSRLQQYRLTEAGSVLL